MTAVRNPLLKNLDLNTEYTFDILLGYSDFYFRKAIKKFPHRWDMAKKKWIVKATINQLASVRLDRTILTLAECVTKVSE